MMMMIPPRLLHVPTIPPNLLSWLLFVVPLVFLIHLYARYRKIMRGYDDLQGHRFVFGSGPVGLLLPDIPYLNRGGSRVWREKHSTYRRFNTDIVTDVGILPNLRANVWLCDPGAIKDLCVKRATFSKPTQLYQSVAIYGPNIVTTEHGEWRKHRKITAPAFSDRNMQLVFQETTRIVETWIHGNAGAVTEVDDIGSVTFEIALQVIAAAGFGSAVDWGESEFGKPAGNQLTFKAALSQTLKNLPLRVACSDTVLNLTSGGRKVLTAYRELENYMKDMIRSRMNEPDAFERRADVFTNILGGSVEMKGDDGFNEKELMGNIFIFLLAGHETSAHCLTFALGLLALHPDIQEKVYEEVKNIFGSGKTPTYAEVLSLKYTEAVIQESLRQYPLVPVQPKINDHDTVLRTTNNDGKPILVPLPAKTSMIIDVIGTHYNPKYWEDPYRFNPTRFLKPYNKDAYMPFSAGPRACVGRRFFEIEAITTLALFVSNYYISLKDNGENFTEIDPVSGQRMMKAKYGALTLNPGGKVGLRFTPRGTPVVRA